MTVPWQIANNTGQAVEAFSSQKQFTPSFQKAIDQCSSGPAQRLQALNFGRFGTAPANQPHKEPKLSRYNRFLTNYTQRGRLFDRLDKRSWHTCLRSTVAKLYPLQLTPKTFSRSSLVTLGTTLILIAV